jgi:hypothetical protein
VRAPPAVTLVVTLLIGCSGRAGPAGDPAVDARPPPALATAGSRVLFIGNSLTYVNDVPGLVRALSEAAAVPLVVDSVTLPGASIGDHLDEGSAARRLAGAPWDFVILQQGPTSRPESRLQFRADAARIAPLIAAAGARAATYMVWPVQSEPQWWDGVHESYAVVAADLDGLFLPAGEVWRAALRLDPGLALYSEDGLHPTPAGSYAAALALFGGLTRHALDGAPPLGGVNPAVAETLRRAATDVLGR